MSDQFDPTVQRARQNERDAKIERDAAMNIAASEALDADAARAVAVDENIRANQNAQAARELATDREVVKHQLYHERAAAENNAFGFYLTLGILVAGLLVTGIYLYWRNSQPESVNVYAAPSQSAPAPPNVIVTPPAAPAASPPPVVNVQPPAVNVQPPSVNVQPPDVNVTTPPIRNDVEVNTPSGPAGAGAGTDRDLATPPVGGDTPR